jgi:hypothetical protein
MWLRARTVDFAFVQSSQRHVKSYVHVIVVRQNWGSLKSYLHLQVVSENGVEAAIIVALTAVELPPDQLASASAGNLTPLNAAVTTTETTSSRSRS